MSYALKIEANAIQINIEQNPNLGEAVFSSNLIHSVNFELFSRNPIAVFRSLSIQAT